MAPCGNDSSVKRIRRAERKRERVFLKPDRGVVHIVVDDAHTESQAVIYREQQFCVDVTRGSSGIASGWDVVTRLRKYNVREAVNIHFAKRRPNQAIVLVRTRKALVNVSSARFHVELLFVAVKHFEPKSAAIVLLQVQPLRKVMIENCLSKCETVSRADTSPVPHRHEEWRSSWSTFPAC